MFPLGFCCGFHIHIHIHIPNQNQNPNSWGVDANTVLMTLKTDGSVFFVRAPLAIRAAIVCGLSLLFVLAYFPSWVPYSKLYIVGAFLGHLVRRYRPLLKLTYVVAMSIHFAEGNPCSPPPILFIICTCVKQFRLNNDGDRRFGVYSGAQDESEDALQVGILLLPLWLSCARAIDFRVPSATESQGTCQVKKRRAALLTQ